MQRPVRVAQFGARQQHQVSLKLFDNCIGLRGIRNHAHRGGRDIRFAADASSKFNLVSGPHRHLRVGNQPT